ncbi:ATPase [Burkholderia contaminans]|nr:ATPase [Burkholderia contaminans]
MADDRPVEVELDSEVTELFVELRPVDSEPIELLADDRPVEVELDSEVTELFVELRPVDSEPIELLADERPVDVEVDSEAIPVERLVLLVLSCATVTASVRAEPSATLVMRRLVAAVPPPTETSEVGAAWFVM